MEKYEALRLARTYWEMEGKGDTAQYALLLARTGIFTHMELSAICDLTPYAARKVTQGVNLPRYRFGEKFDPRTIDSMLVLLEHYQAWGNIPRGVLDLILPYTSLTVVSRMTGIGVSDLANPELVQS